MSYYGRTMGQEGNCIMIIDPVFKMKMEIWKDVFISSLQHGSTSDIAISIADRVLEEFCKKFNLPINEPVKLLLYESGMDKDG